MLRILLVLVWLAITVYAIADWVRTPQEDVPAPVNHQMWLLLIIMTIPMYSLGSLAWLVLRLVAKAEAAGAGVPSVGGGIRRRGGAAPQTPVAPDDDPEFLFRLERDLQRKRKQDEARRSAQEEGPASGQTEASSDPGDPDTSAPDTPASDDENTL